MEAVKKAAGAEAWWWRGGSSEYSEDEDEFSCICALVSLGRNLPPLLQ